MFDNLWIKKKNFFTYLKILQSWIFAGSGPFNSKSPLDDDTVQITTYHFATTLAQSLATLNPTAFMGSTTKTMPVDLNLNGVLVSFLLTKTTQKLYGHMLMFFQPATPTPPAVINITATTLDGNFDLVHGTCKRIIFTFALPYFTDSIIFQVINNDFDNKRFVHWSGLQFKQVISRQWEYLIHRPCK